MGIIGTASTSFYPPFLAARLFRTLDHLTEGRVGLNLVTSSPHAAAQNYGHDKHFEHDLRYKMADEWMTLVGQLWDSWDPDAVILDEDSGYFADPAKVRHVNFAGEFFKSRGPLNTVPSPQQRPVICQAGGSPAGRELAARHADTIIAAVQGVEAMKEYRDDISARMLAHGRKPTDAKVLFLVEPILGETTGEARDRYQRLHAEATANIEDQLAGYPYLSGFDFSKYDLDTPLEDLTGKSNGHQSSVADLMKAGKGKTLRQAASSYHVAESIPLVGTPDDVAVQMGEAMDYAGGTVPRRPARHPPLHHRNRRRPRPRTPPPRPHPHHLRPHHLPRKPPRILNAAMTYAADRTVSGPCRSNGGLYPCVPPSPRCRAPITWVCASPTYKASYTGLLKIFLDLFLVAGCAA